MLLKLTGVVAVVDDPLIDVLLVGMSQRVQETVVDCARLLDDDIEQRLGGFDRSISRTLDALQLSERESAVLVHPRRGADRVETRRQVRVQRRQLDRVICQRRENVARYTRSFSPKHSLL